MKAIAISQTPGTPGKVYYPLHPLTLPIPTPSSTELLIKLHAAALNHRDLFIRQHLYPGTTFNVPLLSDGVGTVVSAGNPKLSSKWLNKRVIISPCRGWSSNPSGPEESEHPSILGGTKYYPSGTLQEYVALPESELEEAPLHLSDVEAAGLPLCGLTAFRAVFTKGLVGAGQNVLITGIGGGVAGMALLFAVAAGATVFVSSGSLEKVRLAKELGASAGVCYKKKEWVEELKGLLPERRKWLDLVVDGAGGDVVAQTTPLLKKGGKIVSYGMTLGPKISYPMQSVLKNIDLLGSTTGSRHEFQKMVEFVYKKQIKPVVSRVVDGMEVDAVDGLFEEMRRGGQFGKLVIRIGEVRARL